MFIYANNRTGNCKEAPPLYFYYCYHLPCLKNYLSAGDFLVSMETEHQNQNRSIWLGLHCWGNELKPYFLPLKFCWKQMLLKKIKVRKESVRVNMYVFYLDFTDEIILILNITYFIFVSQNLSDLCFMCTHFKWSIFWGQFFSIYSYI